MPAPTAGPSATIVFVSGASNLSAPAADEVKAFATKRGNGTIVVTGYGDAASSDPSAQSAALNLGLSRAQSIVDALKAAGVPGTAIRVSAEASGRGAALRLLQ
jgi:outer membrane protein OmpA-like peptidoglycan-associated protein